MSTLIDRRKFMEVAYKPAGYIQDGLVLWLDGINKGASDGTWVDLVGGKVFSAVRGTPAPMEDSFYFNGSSILKNNTNVQGALTTEFCINITGGATSGVLFFNDSDWLVGGQSGGFNYNAYAVGYSPKQLDQLKTLSISTRNAIGDFETLTPVSIGASWTTGSGIMIGGRDWGSTKYIKGYIHSVRMYNRYLTDTEILHNQRVDNERFNLGLTI